MPFNLIISFVLAIALALSSVVVYMSLTKLSAMKKSIIFIALVVSAWVMVVLGTQGLSQKEKADKLDESVLKAFCIDLQGYPGLNRNGFALSYLGGKVEPRIDKDGNPIRCMTKGEFTQFFGKPEDRSFSYFDE